MLISHASKPSGRLNGPPGNLPSWAQRPLGLRLIILFKLIKAPIMLSLAVWLSTAPETALRLAEAVVRGISEAGGTWAHASAGLQAHFAHGVLAGSALLAWLDGVSSAIEGLLLLSGKIWAEWVVIIVLFCLLPLEILYFDWKPGNIKLVILTLNAVIVGYLVWERLLREDTGASGSASWLRHN